MLAARGEIDEALALARRAVQVARTTDMLNTRAYTLVDLSEVCRFAGQSHQQAAALREALTLHELKANVASADRTRARLEAQPA
jgi:hypothetical protein